MKGATSKIKARKKKASAPQRRAIRHSTKRKRTAYHETAHAVVSYRSGGFVGGDVSIVPRTMEGWVRLGYASDFWSDSSSPEHMEARILSYYAGGHAQREVDPSC